MLFSTLKKYYPPHYPLFHMKKESRNSSEVLAICSVVLVPFCICSVTGLMAHAGQLDRMIFKGPFQPKLFYDSKFCIAVLEIKMYFRKRMQRKWSQVTCIFGFIVQNQTVPLTSKSDKKENLKLTQNLILGIQTVNRGRAGLFAKTNLEDNNARQPSWAHLDTQCTSGQPVWAFLNVDHPSLATTVARGHTFNPEQSQAHFNP